MKEFPNRMHVDNKDNFPQLFYDRYLCYLRRDIFELLINRNGDENNFLCLDTWCRNNIQNRKDLMGQMRDTVIKEIEETTKWKCKLSYGGTGLFVYSTDEPPSSCFEDGL
jgi:hypothetical protein